MRKIIETCGFHCIKINNLGVSFGEQVVLKDVNLHIHCGSLNAIIGKNGAGKSTILHALACINNRYEKGEEYKFNYFFTPTTDTNYLLIVEYELGTAEYRFSTTLAK